MLAFSLSGVSQISVYHGVMAREHRKNDKVVANAFYLKEHIVEQGSKGIDCFVSFAQCFFSHLYTRSAISRLFFSINNMCPLPWMPSLPRSANSTSTPTCLRYLTVQ